MSLQRIVATDVEQPLRGGQQLAVGLARKLAAIALMFSFGAASAMANEARVTSCSGCSAMSKQNAAIAAAPPWNGTYDVYLTDNESRSVEKYEVLRESEPGFSLTQATLVPVEREVATFVADYWSMRDTYASSVIEVPPGSAPSLPDFLGNPAVSGDTRIFLSGHLTTLVSFPSNWSLIFSQFVTGRTPALPSQGITVTLRFPDGGTVDVTLTLHVNVSTDTLGVTTMQIVPGSAMLNGVSIPTSPQGYNGYERGGSQHRTTIEDLVRLARMWGIPVTCATTRSSYRFVCDAQGNCRHEVVGSCR